MKIDHPNSLLVNEKQLGNTMILKKKKKKFGAIILELRVLHHIQNPRDEIVKWTKKRKRIEK